MLTLNRLPSRQSPRGSTLDDRTFVDDSRRIVRHRGPVLVVANDHGLLDNTIAERARRGQVAVFEPFSPVQQDQMTWSPLASSRTWLDASLTACQLIAPLMDRMRREHAHGTAYYPQGVDAFAQYVCLSQLAPLLLAVALTDNHLETVLEYAYSQKRRSWLLETLEQLSVQADPGDIAPALEHVAAFEENASDRDRANAAANLQAILRCYRFNRLRESAEHPNVDLHDFFAANGALYIVGDSKARVLLAPLVHTLTLQALNAASRSNRRPLLTVLHCEIAQRAASGTVTVPSGSGLS